MKMFNLVLLSSSLRTNKKKMKLKIAFQSIFYSNRYETGASCIPASGLKLYGWIDPVLFGILVAPVMSG